jgi:Zn-finger protein
MAESARNHIKGVIKKGIVVGSDESCEYYPCHFEGQDCTWCFCPIYPCLDQQTKGKSIISERTGKEVWSCIDCHLVHENTNPAKIMEEIKSLGELKKSKLKGIISELLGDKCG